jgi:DNA-binding NtrC family response regulator
MQGNVLVVDDDPGAVEMMAHRLRLSGLEVRSETDPVRAIQRTLDDGIEVVVSDLRMSPMDGIAFCEQVTTLRPDVPVLLVTGHATVDAEAGAYRAGAFDFFAKPDEPQRFVNAVERAVRHHRLAQELHRLRDSAEHEKPDPMTLPSSAETLISVAELERRYVAHVLAIVKGNKSRAARILGLDRRTLYRKLERTAHASRSDLLASNGATNGARPDA